ncbi:MAG: PASTA domain-containing protein [Ignavibacteriales bacterium]|nr:PASTA domain-containing protein [Ignavibacteriales bacterium]
MKPIIKKILIWGMIATALLAIFAFIADIFIMPWYVKSEEVKVPNVVGMSKEQAFDLLSESKLNVIIEGPRYSEEFPVDHIIYQKPEAGSIVKVNRRVYIVVSGGIPITKMPNVLNRTLRDAKNTIERLGFEIAEITQVKSEEPANTVIEQYPKEGGSLKKGTRVELKVSVGPNIGMVRVPDLLGLSFKEAETILASNSLIIGKITYQDSRNLLPNTVVAQFPAKNSLINTGETVDLFITKNQN